MINPEADRVFDQRDRVFIRNKTKVIAKALGAKRDDGYTQIGFSQSAAGKRIGGHFHNSTWTTDRYQNSRPEGKILLSEETVPGQVDFRCLLSEEATNLIVPVCLSSTHIGWGTIRLEPTWMHIGESVGFALAIAREYEVDLIDLDIDKLQRKLARERILLTYFDDVELIQPDSYVPALQYLGTKGFFPTYKAMAEGPLISATADIWLEWVLNARLGDFIEPNEVAILLAVADAKGEKTIMDWKAFIGSATKMDSDYGRTIQELVDAQFINQTLTRARACEVLCLLLWN